MQVETLSWELQGLEEDEERMCEGADKFIKRVRGGHGGSGRKGLTRRLKTV